VQEEIRTALLESVRHLAGEDAATLAHQLLVFEDWFHYEPGRIWIEHGHQYDPENSFRYNLRRGLEELPDPVHKAEKDLPLGTFFQKYLYNGFGSITFIVPNSRSNFRYFRWLLLNRPRLVAKVATGQIPFFLQVMRRIAKSATSSEALKERHEVELEELAESSKLGETLREIDGFKRVHAASAMLAERIVVRTFKIAAFALLGALLATAVWFGAFHTINQMQAGFGLKAFLILALNFLFMIGAVSGLGYFLLRPAGEEPDPHAESSARKIAKLLDVPLVTFGHTHEEVISRLRLGHGRKAWYYNTGTWIAVFTGGQLLPRERVQYTYLHVRDHEAQLLHWSPGRGEPVPVILLEEERTGESAKPAGAPVG
jgi:hypothetical protein